jgi:threonine dehydratase
MNFGRLRFVAERAEIGERREVLMSFKVPEQPGSFIKLHSYLLPRAVTEFSYRYSSSEGGYIICSFLLKTASSKASGPSVEERAAEVAEIIADLGKMGIVGADLTDNEFAKSHVRHLVGGRSSLKYERIFRFEFPERPGALGRFLGNLKPDWNISLFHYRNHGADVGKVLVGLQPPPNGNADDKELNEFLDELGYPFVEETNNVAYRNFLCA